MNKNIIKMSSFVQNMLYELRRAHEIQQNFEIGKGNDDFFLHLASIEALTIIYSKLGVGDNKGKNIKEAINNRIEYLRTNMDTVRSQMDHQELTENEHEERYKKWLDQNKKSMYDGSDT